MATTFPITGLRSVELIAKDLAAAADFYSGPWGLQEVGRSAESVWLAGDGVDPYLVRIDAGLVDAIHSVTFAAAEDTDLADLRARMLEAGATAEGDIGAIADIGGGWGFAVCDTAGRRYRVVQGAEQRIPIDSGTSRPGRLAHVNINTTDVHRDIRFFEQGLGFKLTDLSSTMGFVRTNDDHHAVVLAINPVDTLNHIAFNHDHWEDVMKAAGRMCDAGLGIAWGPGRHGPGANVFTYFVNPFGFVVEHTAEVLLVDDSYKVGGPEDWIWPKGRVDRWGIAPPKTEECKKAQLAIPFV
ncbi:VOC family protein [Rhizobium sp. FKL33]|uniref:VOC family protein n=1 Tax=Rhizobium sp. FKL33 TaxID=2562307 RepID=UPI0010C10639|nr:VOC family protein [Rhizobium sp. FKL33]